MSDTVVVLINPVTKKPTCFEPQEGRPRIFDGPYRNVMEISRADWEAEKKRVETAIREQMQQAAENRRKMFEEDGDEPKVSPV